MPRLPVDGKKVIEHRITFGTKERELIQDLSTSYRVNVLKIPEILNILDDPVRIIQIAYSIATVAEMFGIETPWPTPVDAYNWFTERDLLGEKIVDSGRPSVWSILTDFWKGEGDFEGMTPGGY